MTEENTQEAAEPEVKSPDEPAQEVAQEPEQKKKKNGTPLHQRFRDLTTERWANKATIEELRKENESLKAKTRIEKPDPESFEDTSQYEKQRAKSQYEKQRAKWDDQQKEDIERKAIEDYKLQNEYQEEQRKAQKVFQDYQSQRAEALNEYSDYAKSENALGQAIQDFGVKNMEFDILESPQAKAIVDHLGKNESELEKIASLYATDPRRAGRELGKLEVKLDKKPGKKNEVPDPLPKGGGAGPVGKETSEMSQKEYNIYMNNKR
jgi:hypothetical protein